LHERRYQYTCPWASFPIAAVAATESMSSDSREVDHGKAASADGAGKLTAVKTAMHAARRAKVTLGIAEATASSTSMAKRTAARLIRPLLVIASDRRAQSGSRAAQPASAASVPLRRSSTVARSEPSRAECDDVAGCIPRASHPSRSPLRVSRASIPELSRSLEDLSV
jgi:hypothetical protein